jgi:hypothetical protein
LREAAVNGSLNLPLPGSGNTVARLAALAELGSEDLAAARLGEGHADAMAILAELGSGRTDGAWGVWAAAPAALSALRTVGGWRLSGRRPWCSGAWACTRALVTASTEQGIRLFSIDTGDPGLSAVADTWPAVGMGATDSRTLEFAGVAAVPVGGVDEYLTRVGFWHGAVGVAACWYGGAVGVARALLGRAAADAQAGQEDPHRLAHLGAVDANLTCAAATLRDAAARIDADPQADQAWLAGRVRAVVESCAVAVLDRVGRACGAGPLCQDGEHARRVADLTVYLRQSHAERDLQSLGAFAAERSEPRTAWSLSAGCE